MTPSQVEIMFDTLVSVTRVSPFNCVHAAVIMWLRHGWQFESSILKLIVQIKVRAIVIAIVAAQAAQVLICVFENWPRFSIKIKTLGL
jgi:hypothetical protein